MENLCVNQLLICGSVNSLIKLYDDFKGNYHNESSKFKLMNIRPALLEEQKITRWGCSRDLDELDRKRVGTQMKNEIEKILENTVDQEEDALIVLNIFGVDGSLIGLSEFCSRKYKLMIMLGCKYYINQKYEYNHYYINKGKVVSVNDVKDVFQEANL